jgi:hypothetical protein
MSSIGTTLTVAEAREAVVARLLTDLENVIVAIRALPASERQRILDRDAEKITAGVAQALSRARGELGQLPASAHLVTAMENRVAMR